jgi:putative SOS response-associated peptidase YedK
VLRTCAVLTTGPNRLMERIHDRMPVILPPEAQQLWLRPEPQEASVLQPLLVPLADESLLEAYEVARVVNSPMNDVAACVEPVAPVAQQAQLLT